MLKRTRREKLAACEMLLVDLHAKRADVYRTLTRGLPVLFKGQVDNLESALRSLTRRIRDADRQKLELLEAMDAAGDDFWLDEDGGS